jgi:hypothetical protein
MPLDAVKRATLVRVLEMLGDEGLRAKAAVALAQYMERSGLSWDELLAREPPPDAAPDPAHMSVMLPDTDWEQTHRINNCRGLWRRFSGRTLVVREVRGTSAPPLYAGRKINRGPCWFAAVDGEIVGEIVNGGHRTLFSNDGEARSAAMAAVNELPTYQILPGPATVRRARA